MPELPEVEVVRAGLHEWVVGRVIESVTVSHPRAIRRHAAGRSDFIGRLRGVHIEQVRRRGKYLWLVLNGGQAVVAHLGMSGQMLLRPAHEPDENHLRVRFRFRDGDPELRFVDQRTFGGLFIDELVGDIPASLQHIGVDPLEDEFDSDKFSDALRTRRTEIKRALLDQTLISGIGNIYADEALWRAKIHYRTVSADLTKTQAGTLIHEVQTVLRDALAQGGTSFDSLYVNVNGESGYFGRHLAAYGQENQPCPRCGTPIVREAFMNRSSFFCPHCQPSSSVGG